MSPASNSTMVSESSVLHRTYISLLKKFPTSQLSWYHSSEIRFHLCQRGNFKIIFICSLIFVTCLLHDHNHFITFYAFEKLDNI